MGILLRLVGIFLALLVLIAAGGFIHLRQSLPAWEGKLELPRLEAEGAQRLVLTPRG